VKPEPNLLEDGPDPAEFSRPQFSPAVDMRYAIRLMARARLLVAARLGVAPEQARWVQLRQGEAGFDHWLACQDQPDWPSCSMNV
jgi:hypothetical protein